MSPPRYLPAFPLFFTKRNNITSQSRQQIGRRKMAPDGEDCWKLRLWSSLPASGGPFGRRNMLDQSIVGGPFGLRRVLRTEKIVGSLDCSRPFRPLASPSDREYCKDPGFWLSVPASGGSCGRRNMFEHMIVVVPSRTHPSFLLPWCFFICRVKSCQGRSLKGASGSLDRVMKRQIFLPQAVVRIIKRFRA